MRIADPLCCCGGAQHQVDGFVVGGDEDVDRHPSGAAGSSGRLLNRHIVSAKSSESIRLYVSARTSGTAIHQASQFTENNQRQMM